MAKFRADHYLLAEFETVTNIQKDADKVLEALKELPQLKDLATVPQRLEGKSWVEILGRVDIPEGSKAFWAMIKKEVTEREPYNLFIRIDVNAEADDIEAAREKVKNWVETEWVPRIQKRIPLKSVRVLRPEQVYMPKLS
ncbi:MAG: hypothetical protein ACTSVD_01375 [Candidatus Thorarchaeota archaeon]|nr:MAG: hypothetical protein DRO93_00675 [Candidatus Thorarchaeota archaeon]